MNRNILALLVAALALPVVGADSKDQVAAAAKKLQGQAYSWKSTMTMAQATQFRSGPTEGKIDKDGTTLVTSSFGENKIQTAIKGGKAAVTNRDGEWQSVADLENSEGMGRFQASMARNFKAPAAQATELLGYVKDLKQDGDAYTGTLTEQGVTSLASFRRGNAEPRPIKNPAGTAKFWVKDGVLSKYEFQVKGSMTTQNGEEREFDRTTTVEIKDVGQTKVELPQDALKKIS